MANRIKKYISKLNPEIIGKQYEATKELAVNKQTKYFQKAETLEKAIKNLMGNIPSILQHYYIAFGEEIITKKTMEEKEIIFNKWVRRGLSKLKMRMIRQAILTEREIWIEPGEMVYNWTKAYKTLILESSSEHVVKGRFAFKTTNDLVHNSNENWGTIINLKYNDAWPNYNKESTIDFWAYIEDASLIWNITLRIGYDLLTANPHEIRKGFGGFVNGWNHLQVKLKDMSGYHEATFDNKDIKEIAIRNVYDYHKFNQQYIIFYDHLKITR